ERTGGSRNAEHGPDRGHQYGQRAGRQRRAFGDGAERLEDHVRAQHHRAHCARQGRRGAGLDHADREIACGRLHGDDPRHLARRGREQPVPRRGRDLDGMGHGRRRHHRHCGAGNGRCSAEVWTTMSTPIIAARGLTKRYGKSAAVDGIDFDVAKGEVFGLLGPNGAGKTTTILMMLGLTEVTAGEITVLGHDPVREPLTVKRRVGYLPDQVGFYDNLTATENLAYTARLMGIAPAERSARIASALARVRLEDVANKRVATFSRGMRQRLRLAEIIMKQVGIATLDEPTSGLDPQATVEFLELIEALKREQVTVLLSSHLLDQVQRVCDRVALFQTGHIVLMGSVPELARRVLGAGFVVEVEADAATDLETRLRAVAGVSDVTRVGADRYRLTADRDVRPEAARAVVAANGALRRLPVDDPSLQAIYTRFFQKQNGEAEGARDAA